MKIRLLSVSTSKNTTNILRHMVDKYSDSIEYLLHIGDIDSDIKASSMTRMTMTNSKNKKHLMHQQKYYGILHSTIVTSKFEKSASMFIDHLHRRDEKYCYKSHNLASTQDYIDYYFILLDVMAEKIINNNITHILFFNVPHLAYDTIIYQIAKALNLNVLIVSQSLFENRFFSMHSMDDYGNIDLTKNYLPFNADYSSEVNLFYMGKVKQGEKRTGRITFKAFINIFTFLILKRQSLLLHPFKLMQLISRASEIYRSLPSWRDPFARFFHVNDLEYFEHIVQYEDTKVDFDVPYVYFPLQLQPEMTTSALGGVFKDQAFAIECLADLLPENILIYVKENPKQGSYMRGPLFFHRLKRISKVRILPSFTDTHLLTEKSLFVSTITGTVGWEAVCKDKCALVFGNTWYQNFPGVFRYNPDLNYSDIINYQRNKASLKCALNTFIAYTHKGVIDRHYKRIVQDFDQENNVEMVADTLYELLTGKIETTFLPQKNKC